ncbi:DUF4249 domain-containing protein [Croceimicrobium sp.]|uniref:DUF4249 domain-containing protein n=1 Tax=Croceimicrobium sp. TaxID=2828340 RepID=UPI003BABA082
MKRFSLFLFVFTLLISISACTDVVELDVDSSEPELVVDGVLTNDRNLFVKLSQTAAYFDNQPFKPISDARVSLWKDGQELVVLDENQNTPGLYESATRGEFNATYQIKVEISGDVPDKIAGTWISAIDTLRLVPPIDSMKQRTLNRNTTPQAFFEGDYALMYFGDLPGEGDYYRVIRNLNDSIFAQENNFISDEGFDGIYFGQGFIPPIAIYGPFEEPEAGEDPDSLGVLLQSVSPEFFDYMQVLNSQVQTGSPFDAPPALVLGNIHKENEPNTYAFGYFQVVGSSRNGIRYQP